MKKKGDKKDRGLRVKGSEGRSDSRKKEDKELGRRKRREKG